MSTPSSGPSQSLREHSGSGKSHPEALTGLELLYLGQGWVRRGRRSGRVSFRSSYRIARPQDSLSCSCRKSWGPALVLISECRPAMEEQDSPSHSPPASCALEPSHSLLEIPRSES